MGWRWIDCLWRFCPFSNELIITIEQIKFLIQCRSDNPHMMINTVYIRIINRLK